MELNYLVPEAHLQEFWDRVLSIIEIRGDPTAD